MHIEGLELSDFRNYAHLTFTPAPTLNILTGANAQGKTNLLEAIAVLTVGRSFRAVKAMELARWDAPRASVSGALRRGESSRSVRRVIAPRDDGAWTIGGEGCTWARAIPFGWPDLAVVNAGPQARRNFLDGFVAKLYPAYASTYRRYRQVLGRRNHLLQGGGDPDRVRARLEPWSEQLIELGLEILTRRRDAALALEREARVLYSRLGGSGRFGLGYRSTLGVAPTAEVFRRALGARLVEEIRRGQTLSGPHRDDVLLMIDGRELRVFGSRGQQRLAALTLRLAEARPVEHAVGSAPILLLDDALSELDPAVQAEVLEHVAHAGQVFLTTAETFVPHTAEACWWHVAGGTVADPRWISVRGAA